MSIIRKIRAALHPLRVSFLRARYFAYNNLVRFVFILRGAIPGSVVSFNVHSRQLHFVCKGHIVLKMLTERQFEKEETQCFLNHLPANATVIDIGANIGYYSILAAKFRPESQILAFEPVKSTFNILNRNIELNKLDSIKTFCVALTDEPGVATMQINSVAKDGLNTLGRPAHQASEIVGTETVKTCRLDDILDENGINHVDLIKIDVEGAEFLVLRGASKLLKQDDGPVLMFEVSELFERGFDYKFKDIVEFLNGFDYEIKLISGDDVESLCQGSYESDKQTTAIASKRRVPSNIS